MSPGKRVLITGASSGIGEAAARLFSEAGYAVAGCCRDPEAAAESMAKRSSGALPFTLLPADLSLPGATETLFAAAEKALGGVDVLINNAGVGELGSVEDTDIDFARRLFEVNYFSPVRLIQLALPGMRGRGRGAILNIGSIVHSLQFPFKAQYCGSKSALSSFTLSLRHEVHPHGIRVHLFEPGWVRSAFHERLRPALKPGSPYADRLKPFLDFSRDGDKGLPDGMDVAKVLWKTLQNPSAPARIAVGPDARKWFFISRFLSHDMADKILRWKLAKKAKGD